MTSSAVFFHGASSSSASSPPLMHPWDYHVFLSFRGEDTRKTFTAHLSYALKREGINTYIDDELERGEEISHALLKAIEGSRISIVVFSENYADSRWCLVELTKILECKKNRQQTILPLFYHVDPSDVRNQRNSFGKAFAKLKDRFVDDKKKVEGWEAALKDVADLSGYHLSDGNEAEFIYEIVEDVSRIVNTTPLHVTEHPVGIDTRVQDIMKSHLCVGMEDVRIVGIVGAGGIGKSTIAKAIYNSIAREFTGRCFLANVRERSKGEGGLVQLQEELLYDILGNSKSFNVRNVDKGMNVIKDRLSSRRVLLILDDVDQLDVVKKLAGGLHWFGLGSRIIITTRDERVIKSYENSSVYKMEGLDNMEALKLFSWHAFKSDNPMADYGELTEYIIHYAGGLPLALEVLGSYLKDRNIDEWQDTLKKIKKVPCPKIQDILRISYDGLEENEKDIFLDMACFFKGEKKDYIREVLHTCEFFSVIGISRLVEKCLITIDDHQRVGMHDLVQDMGKEVVRQESLKGPENRSRLWFEEDIRYVLEENMGTNKIEGINLLASPEEDIISLHPEAFEKMKKLRVFISRNARFRGELNYLPNELRVLDWDHYPWHFLPSNFNGKKLSVFRMCSSFIKELRGGGFENLTSMELSWCNEIREIPNFSSCSNLKELSISNCSNLVEVHQSVGSLDKLVELTIASCYKLQNIPKSLKLRSLEELRIYFCDSLKDFPEIECEMENATTLHLHATGIHKLPSSFLNMSRLQFFYLSKSRIIKTKVSMTDSDSAREIPSLAPIRAFSSLEELNLGWSGLSQSELFTILFNCSDNSLRDLNLSGTKIERLPSDMARFDQLKYLSLDGCDQLLEIPELPPNIEWISASGCKSLKRFSQPSKILCQFNESGLQAFEKVDLTGCDKLEWSVPKTSMFQVTMTDSDSAREYEKKEKEIPSLAQIRAFSSLKYLILGGTALSQSDLFTILFNCSDNSLEYLILSGTNIKRLPSDMARFDQLTCLYLDGCDQLLEIPELPPNIAVIRARRCKSLKRFSQLSKILWQFNESGLQALKRVDLTGCDKLECSVPKTTMFQGFKVWSPAHFHSEHFCAFEAVFPGSTKPDSLHPCKETSGVFEIDIGALRYSDKIITGIALYVVFGPSCSFDYLLCNATYIARLDVYDCRGRSIVSSVHYPYHIDSNNVLLLYIITAIDKEGYGMERVQVRNSDPELLVIKYCGFYPVYMNDEEEAAKDKSVMLCEGVDSNLESHWERKRKYSSTFGTQISSLEDAGNEERKGRVGFRGLNGGVRLNIQFPLVPESAGGLFFVYVYLLGIPNLSRQ